MEEIIKKQILNSPQGMITYADFIETALYHPEQGYYMKGEEKIGRAGDFYTTSNISGLYGTMIAKWYSQIVLKYGLPAVVCEIGAGTGAFAQSFINEWNKTMSIPLMYTLVEASPYHRKLQQERIELNQHIRQLESLDKVKPYEGLLFSNELFDALPVHLIQKKNHKLYEVMITVEESQITEKLVLLQDERILNFLHTEGLELNEGQRMEIPISMVSLIHSLSNVLVKGIVLTVDYGYTNEEWMDPAHKNGSLRGYRKHKMMEDVLKDPGNMDITSHVHFDALIKIGENAGFSYIEKLRQDEFFLAIGILKELQENYDHNPFSELSKRNRAIRSLIMPSGISPSFQVILQHKGMETFALDWHELNKK